MSREISEDAVRLDNRPKVFLRLITLAVLAALALGSVGCGRLAQRRFGSARGTAGTGSLTTATLESGGITRTYHVHVPPHYNGSTPYPLVLAFRGHGGDGPGQEKISHLAEVADANNFIVVFPDGVDHGWNDGRQPAGTTSVDDVGFTRAMVERLEADYKIDKGRVYATGFSNGGFFVYRLAIELPDTFAAVAPVAANLGEPLASGTKLSKPVSVCQIEGTADPLVPWGGGTVGGGLADRGSCISAGDTISFWVGADGASGTPSTFALPDADPDDGSNVLEKTYSGGREGSEVIQYEVTGGGHAWPGGWQYLGVRIIGSTNRDFDAGEAMWDFFKSHSRRGRA